MYIILLYYIILDCIALQHTTAQYSMVWYNLQARLQVHGQAAPAGQRAAVAVLYDL